jgi:hypothetical protein
MATVDATIASKGEEVLHQSASREQRHEKKEAQEINSVE